VQGNCTSAPTPVNPGGVGVAPLRNNDEGLTPCIIFTPSDLFRVEAADYQELWIDNLYLRVTRIDTSGNVDLLPRLLTISARNAAVYVTYTTFQLDESSCRAVALEHPTSKLYAYSMFLELLVTINACFSSLQSFQGALKNRLSMLVKKCWEGLSSWRSCAIRMILVHSLASQPLCCSGYRPFFCLPAFELSHYIYVT
jgi:hypothetical protein